MVLLSHRSLFVDSTPLAVRGPVETEPVNVLFPPIVCALVVSTLLLRVVARSVLFSEMDGTARDWGMVTAPVEAIVNQGLEVGAPRDGEVSATDAAH